MFWGCCCWVFFFFFFTFSLNLSVVSEGRLCRSGRGELFPRNERDERSLIATGSCMTSVAIHCLCTVLCFVLRSHTHKRKRTHGCMKQCFFPDECLHRCLVLK